jgi:hypothetical protein
MNDASHVTAPLGEAGSGRVRYGAAMALYADGKLSAEQLECFRIASADDALDAAEVMRERGLPLPPAQAPSGEALIRALVEEVDVYLGKLPGPGIAEVRNGLQAYRSVPFNQPKPANNAVVQQHLPAALAAAAQTEPALTALMSATAPLLNWIAYDLYDREVIGESFATSHAYCTLLGGEGAFRVGDYDLGLFLIAPHVLYRDHRHPAPELYAPLTGPHGWRFKPGAPLTIKQAHEPVWNEPNQHHLTKVGPVPFFCIFGWTRDTDKPAEVLPATDWPQIEAARISIG